jgi:hypothetical protein
MDCVGELERTSWISSHVRAAMGIVLKFLRKELKSE